MKNSKLYTIFVLIMVAGALIIKLGLFAFAERFAPGAKFQVDTPMYLDSGMALVSRGVFVQPSPDGNFYPELYRTPGYPLFLGVLHGILKINESGIILVQIALTLIAALITYKTAMLIDHRLGFLSALIILYDPPITIFSLMLLTEALFLVLVSLFMYTFAVYLKEKKLWVLAIAAVCLVAAAYVRPIIYYLGFATAIFIIYSMVRMRKARISRAIGKAALHAGIFLLIVCGLVGLWRWRNYRILQKPVLCLAENANLQGRGLVHSYARGDYPEYKQRWSAPATYYINLTWRSFVTLMTTPGTLKEFHAPTLKLIGKIIAFPWLVFWTAGFFAGAAVTRRDERYQFLLLAVIYFMAASIGGLARGVGVRFRLPMMPFIAIIAAYGLLRLYWFFVCKRNIGQRNKRMYNTA